MARNGVANVKRIGVMLRMVGMSFPTRGGIQKKIPHAIRR